MPRVVMVKKLLANGEPCAKCSQAEQLLRSRGVWDQIDEVVWAREDEPESPGMKLATQHEVQLAPFFLLEAEDGGTTVETSTLKVIKRLRKSSPVSPPAPKAGTLTRSAIAEQAAALSDAHPEEILRWGLERFGSACGIAFSGAEDVVLLELARRSGLDFSVFCLDTGRLHPETYRFVDRVRAHYGVELTLLSPRAEPLEAFVRRKGLFSFYEDGHGECCAVRKLEPLRRALSGLDAWVSGQRRDQSPSTRGSVQVLEVDGNFEGRGSQLVKLNPLAAWTSQQVWQYIRDNGLPYNELHDRGYLSIGCEPCTRPTRPGEHERAARWWWEESTQRECGLHVKAR